MTTKTKECDCEDCLRCKCGHSATAHHCGDGHCYFCKCQAHSVPVKAVE